MRLATIGTTTCRTFSILHLWLFGLFFANPKMLHFILSLLFICFLFILVLSINNFREWLSIMWTCKVLFVLLISVLSSLVFFLFYFNRYRSIIEATIKMYMNYSHSTLTAYCHQTIITFCVLYILYQWNDFNNLYTYYKARSQSWTHNQQYQVAMSWWMVLVESSLFIRNITFLRQHNQEDFQQDWWSLLPCIQI